MEYDRNYLEDLRNKIDIVEVVESYLKLKKSGKNYVGLCPFHNDRSPSFTVNRERGLYHCFGCGAGGNVFTFIMEMEKVVFADAVRQLANRFNLTPPVSVVLPDKNERLFKANEKIATIYHEILKKNSKGAKALEYLYSRGINEGSLNKFLLGYSPYDSILINKMNLHGLDKDTLLKLGLVVQRESGLDDALRDRIVFPIFDQIGRVVGFAGRSIKEDLLPKYLNIGETSLFKKSRILYGLAQAKSSISKSKKVILVEGYMDVIMLHQQGFNNAVSTMGTSLTTEQVELLKRWADEVTLMYDSDEGGKAATKRSIDLLKEVDIKIKALTDYGEKDPDEYLRKHGKEKLDNLLKEALPVYELIWKIFLEQGDLKSIEGKSSFIKMVLNFLVDNKDLALTSEYVRRLSEITLVKEELFLKELERMKRKEVITNDAVTPLLSKMSGKERLRQELEEFLTAFLLRDVEKFIKLSEGLTPKEIVNKQLRLIFEKVFKIIRDEGILSAESMNRDFTESEIAYTSKLLIDEKYEVSFDELQSMVRMLRLLKNEVEIENLKGMIKQSELAGDFEKQRILLAEFNNLLELSRGLKSKKAGGLHE